MLAEPIVIIIHGTQKSNCWIQLIQEWMSIFFFPRNGEKMTKKVQTFLMRADTSWTLSVWDNDDKGVWVDVSARKHGLFVEEALWSGPHLPGDSSWAEC